ncbi:MAG: hypothetical protein COA42_17705 [Alteromonadaceae bacterium]|nr:MAG: hypothetical protein COA42_17705 [Alteromonadaceae bacterium]
MDLTFKEKSLFTQLIASSIAFFTYFYTTLPQSSAFNSSALITPLIALVTAIVVINIIGHIIAAMISTPEGEDERDELILLKASKTKATLLSAGIVLSVLFSLKLESEFWTIQILLGVLVSTDIAEKLIQLFHYRKGL